MSEPRRDRDLAREAAVQQAASTLVYLAIMVGITVALTKRDTIVQQGHRVARWLRRAGRRDAARAREEREVAYFRREMADWERGQATSRRREPPGGLYAPPS